MIQVRDRVCCGCRAMHISSCHRSHTVGDGSIGQSSVRGSSCLGSQRNVGGYGIKACLETASSRVPVLLKRLCVGISHISRKFVDLTDSRFRISEARRSFSGAHRSASRSLPEVSGHGNLLPQRRQSPASPVFPRQRADLATSLVRKVSRSLLKPLPKLSARARLYSSMETFFCSNTSVLIA